MEVLLTSITCDLYDYSVPSFSCWMRHVLSCVFWMFKIDKPIFILVSFAHREQHPFISLTTNVIGSIDNSNIFRSLSCSSVYFPIAKPMIKRHPTGYNSIRHSLVYSLNSRIDQFADWRSGSKSIMYALAFRLNPQNFGRSPTSMVLVQLIFTAILTVINTYNCCF